MLVQKIQDDGDPLQVLDIVGTIDDFNFVEVPVNYAKIFIEKMKISSAGYDNFPIHVFKHKFDINCPVVTKTYNRIISSRVFS